MTRTMRNLVRAAKSKTAEWMAGHNDAYGGNQADIYRTSDGRLIAVTEGDYDATAAVELTLEQYDKLCESSCTGEMLAMIYNLARVNRSVYGWKKYADEDYRW